MAALAHQAESLGVMPADLRRRVLLASQAFRDVTTQGSDGVRSVNFNPFATSSGMAANLIADTVEKAVEYSL